MKTPPGWPFRFPKERPPDARDETDAAPPEGQEVLADAFDRYATSIYRFAYRRLGNREDAQDVTSQVFMKASRALDPSFDDASRRSWLFRAARTAIVDVWRSYGDVLAIPLEWYAEEPARPDRSTSDAASRVERLLAQLKPVQRRVLELRFLDGRSLLETAKELGLTEANVKVIQHRAVRRAAELESGDANV